MNDKEIKNFFSIPHCVLEDEKFIKLEPSIKVVFLYMAKYQNRYQKENFYRTIRNICQDTGLSKATVIKAKKVLVENGFLIIQKNGNYEFKNKIPDHYTIEFLFEIKEV